MVEKWRVIVVESVKNRTQKKSKNKKGPQKKIKLHPMKYWLGLKWHPNSNQKNKGGN